MIETNAATDDPATSPAPAGASGEPASGPSELATKIYLGVFVTYVVLLGIGVFAEAFHIQWILSWPIY
ncbi:MAG: hypothetical protein IPK07_21765 [Deltaproteobacteria bacterium]|nr:hypothetical protein [Deltaproteobacteria bacterium]